jgi:hypothetical protein
MLRSEVVVYNNSESNPDNSYKLLKETRWGAGTQRGDAGILHYYIDDVRPAQ